MKIDNNLMRGNTRMLILAIIDTGNKYGYEIIKELEAKSYGAFVIKEGTLYPILHDLEEEEMIFSKSYKMENNRVRKYYKITKKGKAYLYAKKKEWAEFVSKVDMIIGKEAGSINI
ncbi:helix-turn-helix transcriptional regulator [Sedimentibacter hydroxybenzoicus DSM 7310]|uniref:Helix-turn-helix transcriptional regulator n=1 Tax=Sedimentibacter hydroxybenzoicus DSM 7310 TaxID=1123245 RepID=A0A974GY32_SEDHY|nr:helix-turn-helix transcriptional regulator [Sedimentibacter hydroxybenzoicus]NYB75801.1 helix-turn-helix transcriptional regulator [Sedimentibacter hydroxybenzoicus DSM 7310]